MSMTKTEKARMDDLKREARIAKALSWPTYKPEVMPEPKGGSGGVVRGFAINPYRARERMAHGWVEHAASTSFGHIRGNEDRVRAWAEGQGRTREGGTQRACVLYATRRDGLMAIRNILTRDFAGILADLDAAIEKESPADERDGRGSGNPRVAAPRSALSDTTGEE